jgi:hypothetical protein
LMNDDSVRDSMGQKAKEYIKAFDAGNIGDKFFNFILSSQ